jgi:hypothetical protein
MRSAIAALPALGIDPRGGAYAQGLVDKAETLIDPPSFVLKNWYALTDFWHYGREGRDLRADDCAEKAEAWLKERGVRLEDGGFTVHRIRQPRSLSRELRECALETPFDLAYQAAMLLPVIGLALGALFLSIGPFAGSFVALSRYSRGRVEPPFRD